MSDIRLHTNGVPLLPKQDEPEPEAPPEIAMVFRPRKRSIPVHVRERQLRKYALRALGFVCLGSTDVAQGPSKRRRAADVAQRGRPLPGALVKQIVGLRRLGYTVAAICRHLGVCRFTVYKYAPHKFRQSAPGPCGRIVAMSNLTAAGGLSYGQRG
jgi:hypothetical protein